MTAEVAILNREAVAMAADSAATMSTPSGQKVLSSANKVFALSKLHPVGIMVYGNAVFMNIPWETIIKEYRKELGDTPYNSLKQYGEGFIEFLKNSISLFPGSEQEYYVMGNVAGYFVHIRDKIETEIENKTAQKSMAAKDFLKLSEKIIAEDLHQWQNGQTNLQKQHSELVKKYKAAISKVEKDIFENMPLTANSKKMLLAIAGYLFLTFPTGITYAGTSGIVISGFGEAELFPSLVYYSIEGMANNVLKYREENYHKIDFNDSALIIPFAQHEMVITFMEGISEYNNDLYEQILNETVDNYPKLIVDELASKLTNRQRNQLLKKITKIGRDNLLEGLKNIENIKQQHYVHPILSVVTFLSKIELAEMAESLVNLTSLRKKISIGDESVGGLVDVAVISKGEGLIWIKRKHYFESELNHQYFVNYLKR